MKVIKSISQMQEISEKKRAKEFKIGLVPTMGFLHKGHLSLVRLAVERSDFTIVSIFVNPTQFGPGEDYQDYPRDFGRDCELLEKEGTDAVFAPSVEEMYPQGYLTYVEVEDITKKLCGLSRPTHFRGVTTVVTKLFLACKPHFAFFGQKDAQQAIIIKRMIKDLNFDVEIIIGPIIRESDGLAMSSRNLYLSEKQRKEAPVLYKSLKKSEAMIKSGERDSAKIISAMKKLVSEKETSQIDYISIVDTRSLEPIEKLAGEVLVALAVKFGRARLIDNMIVDLKDQAAPQFFY